MEYNIMNSIKISLVIEKKRDLEIIKICLEDETRLQLSQKVKRKQIKKSYKEKIVKI